MHHRERNVAARTAGRFRAGHEMPMCQMDVTNAKANQDHHSVSDSLGGGVPSFVNGLIVKDPLALTVILISRKFI